MLLDIICEIFKFLDRNELEKCQLVKKSWDKIIKEYENSLPLRRFRTIGFDYGAFLVVTADNYGFRPEPHQFKSFKYCVFETFYWYQVLEEICIPNLVKSIRDITKFTDRPLKAIEFIYDARLIDERERVSHDRKMFSYFEEIMGKLVNASKATLTISFEIFREILGNPSILEIPSLPVDVTIAPQNWTLDPNIEPYILSLEHGTLLKFINSSRFDVSPYTLSGWYASENFCEEYFKIFWTCKNPNRLIKHIETVNTFPTDSQNTPCKYYVASDNEFAVSGTFFNKQPDHQISSGVLCGGSGTEGALNFNAFPGTGRRSDSPGTHVWEDKGGRTG